MGAAREPNEIGTQGYLRNHHRKENNVIVLDIDVKDDGLDEFNKYLLCHAKPETYTVQTPSGGFHYYFNYDSANEQDAWLIQRYLRTRTNYRGKGLDIRAAGGYVVGAGSRVNCNEYKVVNNTAINDIPSDLLGWLLESVTCEEPPITTPIREAKRRNIDIKPSE